jgi:hypothetical protein
MGRRRPQGHPAKLAAAEARERRRREERQRSGLLLRAAARNPVLAEALKRQRLDNLSR